ncbi:MAG TPA: glycosyltransferase family 4 protein [Candidatus Dormibacteraeota bacterium]
MALLHYTAPPVAGGVEAILGEHRRLLALAGHDVLVLAGRGDATLVPELDSRHPEVEALYQALRAGEFDPAVFAELQERIRARLEPLLADRELVIAHNVGTMPFNLPLAAALADGTTPVLHWVHDIAWLNPRYEGFHREGPPYDLLHQAQPGAGYVVISEVRRRELQGLLGIDPEVIPNGIDLDQFLGVTSETRTLLREAGMDDADPLVLVPLRVTRRKRLELALEAAARLRPRFPGLGMVVTGPLGPHAGDNRDYWRELFELRARLALDDVVAFLHELAPKGAVHPVGPSTMAELYRISDVVLLPSDAEGFGLPVIEAAAVRAPIVCSDIEVLREIGGAGMHAFPAAGGAEAVAAAVTAALQEPIVEERRRVAATYSWDRILPRLEGAVERLLA